MKLNKKILHAMYQEIDKSSSIYKPSLFWNKLGNTHLAELNKRGINNFKQTVNKRYFNWGVGGLIYHQLQPIFKEIAKGNFDPFLKSKIFPKKQSITQLIYKVVICYLFDFVSRKDRFKIFSKVNEPKIGKPLLIKYKGRYISQDLVNSVHELYQIIDKIHYPINKKIRIVELGGGYGRLAYVFLKTFPKISYYLVDLPPALYIAQEYLKKLFPKEKIFYFRHFSKGQKINKDLVDSRISFLTPNQMEFLPDKFFDIAINISSFHEMSIKQIKNYFRVFDRITKDYLYMKQWIKSRVKDNNYLDWTQYPVPKNWKIVYKNKHEIQSLFFESLFQIEK